jgi:hypothetical protein
VLDERFCINILDFKYNPPTFEMIGFLDCELLNHLLIFLLTTAKGHFICGSNSYVNITIVVLWDVT